MDGKRGSAPPLQSSSSEVREKYIQLPLTQYALLFCLVALILSIFSIGVEKRTDYGLQRVERLWLGNRPVWVVGEESGLHNDAGYLGVRPQDLMTAQYVVDTYLNKLQGERTNIWSRLIVIEGERHVYLIGLRFFLNLFIAALFAGVFYYRRRGVLAEELIEHQASRYTRVNRQLETKMEESTRIIEKLNRLQDKLVEADKLASIGRLSATLAHEIRNPLSIIQSSTGIIQDDLEEGSASESALYLIRDEVNRLDRIITVLLDFARPKEPHLERTWVKTIVRHWLPPVVEELEKERIQIVPQLDVDGEVVIDPDQLYQVFLNIMWNARDALRGHPNPHVFVRLEDGGDRYVHLVVQDTGMGMLPEVLKQMREPFYTTKAQGTGLGIPVSIQLLEGMNGELTVDSILEFGTTVTLKLLRAGATPKRHSSDSAITFLRSEDKIEPLRP